MREEPNDLEKQCMYGIIGKLYVIIIIIKKYHLAGAFIQSDFQ